MTLKELSIETKNHLLKVILPFWMNLRDEANGGYFGEMDMELNVDKNAVKGCILNSRITWFMSSVYALIRDGLITEAELKEAGVNKEDVLLNAKHAYSFLKNKCIDSVNGGIFWSLNADGTPFDTTKHTYNQAFCIYALSAYYEITKDEDAIKLAFELVDIIETKCKDEIGYLEAFTIDFGPESNEKLSENGVMAAKTMNTLLHVFEAYTGLYKVSGNKDIKAKLEWMMDLFAEKIYNPALHRQEVFFDENYNTIIDLHSYGHDIETAWLMDLGVDTIGEASYKEKMTPITKDLTQNIYKIAFDGNSLANECDKGEVNEHRIWWVQAESVVGFLNGYLVDKAHTEYFDAACAQWEFIKRYVHDKREGGEWYWEVDKEGKPYPNRPIVEEWKCPYHNGRMCMEVIKRAAE